MTRREEYRQRFSGFWKKYRKNRKGMVGLIIILFFLTIALFAPLIAPWPSPGFAPALAFPTWLLPFHSTGFQSIHPVENWHFNNDANGWRSNASVEGIGYTVVNNSHFNDNADGWVFSAVGGGVSITDAFYRSTAGSDLVDGSGPGCYTIQYYDLRDDLDYGRTDAYFDYNFTFDADRYPPGLASFYPSRVSVSYSIIFIIENNYVILPAANVIFSLEMINSSGPPIEIFSSTYQTSGTFGWFARTKNMPSEDIISTFTTTQNMTLRFHFVFQNYNAENTPYMRIHLDDIQCSIENSYTYTTTNPQMEGQHTTQDGSSLTGPGSFRFYYTDTDNSSYYVSSSGWIQTDITWDYYDRPKTAYLRYNYKIENLTAWGDAQIHIIQECYVEANGWTEEILRSDAITENRDWTSSPEWAWNDFMITNTFERRGTLWIRLRILITDPTPEDTPSFIIFLDDCTLEIVGNYHGFLGAGQSGEDIWAQLLWGAQNAFRVAIIAALIATISGLVVGLIAGYYGGIIDEILSRLTDFFLIIPGLALMIVLAAILQPRWWNIVWIIALIGWTSTARIVRSKVITEKQRAYVDAARAIGASDFYIISKHILPIVIPILFAQFILAAAGALLAEAGLAFLGLTHPLDVSWGRMLMQAFQSGASYIGAWWYVFFPGLCILFLALAFTLVGYAIDEVLNPPDHVQS